MILLYMIFYLITFINILFIVFVIVRIFVVWVWIFIFLNAEIRPNKQTKQTNYTCLDSLYIDITGINSIYLHK